MTFEIDDRPGSIFASAGPAKGDSGWAATSEVGGTGFVRGAASAFRSPSISRASSPSGVGVPAVERREPMASRAVWVAAEILSRTVVGTTGAGRGGGPRSGTPSILAQLDVVAAEPIMLAPCWRLTALYMAMPSVSVRI